MKIKHTVERPDGSVTFQGDLSGPELDFMLEYAINNLLAQGVLPFVSEKSVDASQIAPVSDRQQ